jgi:hypothetical protein
MFSLNLNVCKAVTLQQSQGDSLMPSPWHQHGINLVIQSSHNLYTTKCGYEKFGYDPVDLWPASWEVEVLALKLARDSLAFGEQGFL